MKNMKRGFTMIELIFVIVIIGILAAVAIPKLAATRDDAQISSIITNASVAFKDIQSFYTSQGASGMTDTNTTISTVTNVVFTATGDCNNPDTTSAIAGGYFVLCDQATETGYDCIGFSIMPDGTQLGVITNVGTGSAICNAVATDPAIISMAGPVRGTVTWHKLGGKIVNR